MSGNPWDKFFWQDWESDPALRLCSLAAQGLWMRCLCICAKADPKGYLLVAGQPLTPADVASLVGKPESEVVPLLNELAEKGVYSRDRRGRIFNRRMVRDVQKSAVARQNGNLGGNPSLRKDLGNSASVNPPDKPEVKPQEPEAKASIQKEKGIRRKRVSYLAAFEEFWKAYPTDANMSKLEASKAWERLSEEDQTLCVESLPAFRAKCEGDATYRPVHAVRYITQRRFDGFIELARKIAALKASHEQRARA